MNHSALPRLHKPKAVAEALGVSEWLVKDRCRKRSIPFTRIGTAYGFTDDQVAEIIRMHAVPPEQSTGHTTGRTGRRCAQPEHDSPAVQLQARRPRRMRGGGGDVVA